MSIENIYSEIMPQIDSYINLIDVLEYWRNIPKSNNQEGHLVLLTKPEKTFEILEKIQYKKFLEYVIENIQINDDCKQIFLSEGDQKIYLSLQQAIDIDRKKTSVVTVEGKKQYEIKTTCFMANILYAPLSQMHNVFASTVYNLNSYNKNVEIDFKKYLNAQSSSPLENFIQEWCFEKMGFQKKELNGIIVHGLKDLIKVGRPW